jgi:hypothetical protein
VIAIASSFPDRYADALGDPRLTDAEVGTLLDLARTVAHATERRYAPLSTYLAGRFVARRTAAGVPLEDAVAEAAAAAAAEAEPGSATTRGADPV